MMHTLSVQKIKPSYQTPQGIIRVLDSMGLNNQGEKRTFKKFGLPVTIISIGQIHICAENEGICTIVGSCITACIRDPILKIGGMNHFILPGNANDKRQEANLYGQWCMELLLNGLYKLGAKKKNLEAKIFGGGNILSYNELQPGAKNIEFIRTYLNNEHINIHTEDLGSNCSRKLYYFPENGDVKLKRTLYASKELNNESDAIKQINRTLQPGDIEIF